MSVTTCEGRWTMVRIVLRPFRGVHTTYPSAPVAIGEVRINRQRITPEFIAQLRATTGSNTTPTARTRERLQIAIVPQPQCIVRSSKWSTFGIHYGARAADECTLLH